VHRVAVSFAALNKQTNKEAALQPLLFYHFISTFLLYYVVLKPTILAFSLLFSTRPTMAALSLCSRQPRNVLIQRAKRQKKTNFIQQLQEILCRRERPMCIGEKEICKVENKILKRN
jgi:hypothetical protein